MNSEQLTSLLRTVLQFAGGIAVGRGWIDPETSTAIIGALVTVAATAWSLYTRRSAGLVASAAAVPSVQSITTTSQKMANAVDSAKVQAAH
ncbi:hypothetical protein [Methylobacterium sp. J-090]|uniref:Pam3-gp28 family putative phage holin n=1 Tax=Methylobacterium sp. J-090 TaxID=2836666 RepID=UPI001FBB140D|nr:hypothetical protein [Methylobacterium sp. J-090]MCJ2080769.1 hypothetical protein [Methylobacterium sp. J-090]